MTDLKSCLLNLIQIEHRGKARAITVDQLATTTMFESVSERTIRKMIRELNFEGYLVLTSTSDPFGVYFADTQEEVKEYVANLGSRMKAILERMKVVDKNGTREFLKGQMEMFS